MLKTTVRFFLSPADVGVEKYSTEEIAELMKHSEAQHLSGLYEFGLVISRLFDDLEIVNRGVRVIVPNPAVEGDAPQAARPSP